MKEKDIENSIKEYLKSENIFFFKTHPLWGQKGLPDIIVCYKGIFVAFEIKKEGNKPTPLQRKIGEAIRKSGGYWYVVYSVEDVKSILAEIKVNKGLY